MAYNAFISYSHTADSTLAAALQSALHRFAKPWYKLRGLHIFRDQTNLAVNPALWSSIRAALDQSLFLILFASPEAAASPWVAKEAEYWISRNGTSHVLLVLTGGTLAWDRSAACFTPESTNALPPSLLRSFPEEPLFLDLLWARDSAARLRMRETRFHEAVLQLASTILNRPKDELDGVDIRGQRHVRFLAAAALAAILATGLFALRQTYLSHNEAVQNEAAALAAKTAAILADNPDRTREAALLAIESNRLHPSVEANQALREAVSLLPAGAQFYKAEDADPDERIRGIAFSPDGAILAVGRDKGSTQLIDAAAQKQIGYLGPDEHPAANIQLAGDPQADSLTGDNADNVVSVAFNSTGTLIGSGARNGLVHVWSLPGAHEALRIFLGTPVAQIDFHPKTNQLMTASDDGHLRIFDIGRAALVADFSCEGKIVSAAFSPSGDLAAALSSEGPVYLFDTVHHKLLRKLFGGGDAALSLSFSNDGKRLATAMGSFAFVWDVTTGGQLLKATHAASSETLNTQQWIDDAAISSDGKFLAYAARGDSLARVWNVETGRQILELKHKSRVAVVSFSADGTKLGTGSYDGTARVWELPSGRELERVPHAGGSEVVAFSRGDARFAAGGMDGSLSISEIRRARRPIVFHLPGDVRSVAFSPDGKRFAIGARSAHWSPLVRIADTNGNVLRDIEFNGAPVIDKLVFSGANHVIAQWSSKLFLIDVDQGSATPLPELRGDLRIEPSGKVLATQPQGVTQLYTLPDLKPAASVNGPSSGLLRIADEGRLLAFDTSTPPKQFHIDLWSTVTKARISRITLPAELSHIAVSPNGTILMTTQDEQLQAWEIPSGKRRLSLTDTAGIDSIVSNASSAYLATLTSEHLTIWDAVKGTRLAQLPATTAAAFSPDGRYLLTRSGEGSATLWLWRSSDLQAEACARLTGNLSREEWARWFARQPYHLTCPNLPASN